MYFKKFFAITCLCFAGSLLNPAQAQQKFTIEDLANLTSVSEPQISPDGKSIVFVVSRPDTIKNMMNRELVCLDISSRNQKAL
ncbi:MAG TPA: hypothetical protein VLL95_13665, partial [Phnomibacter sp.]|nr:hypothetical protein [Phnomibacter sp.]